MRTLEVEIAVADYFGVRQNIIIPNASWGIGVHECDLLVVRPSKYAIEVEIKVSKSDLKKDVEKRHGHKSSKIKELWFAIPDSLYESCKEFIPLHAGILLATIKYHDTGHIYAKAQVMRPAVTNKDARPLNDGEYFNAARLAAMRVWGLKEKLARELYGRQKV